MFSELQMYSKSQMYQMYEEKEGCRVQSEENTQKVLSIWDRGYGIKVAQGAPGCFPGILTPGLA